MAIAICAAGPSLKQTFRQLRHPIACINHSHDFLIESGITPDYCFIYERKPLHSIKKRVAGCAYLSRGNPLTMADCEILGPGCPAVSVAWGLGFRSFDLFGFDMCHADTTHADGNHAYSFIDELTCEIDGVEYHTNHRLLYHLRALADLIERGIEIRVHGNSLMAAIAKNPDSRQHLPDSMAFSRAKGKWHETLR